MKALRISTALSLLVLSATLPQHAGAAGDPNLDSGVGSAASRGPFGFNNTNNGNIYDTPANDYGVWRDAYGALRDRGMIPDNLTTRVPEPTWEDTHPAGPPKPTGAPGGLAAGGFGFGGFGGLGGLGGVGSGFLSGFGTFGSPAFRTATASAFNHPIPSNITGLGPFETAPRTAFGFLGSMPGVWGPVFNGQRYMGRGSGYIPTGRVTATNTTAADGTSRTITSWNTGAGTAKLIRTTRPDGAGGTITTDTFQMNGNTYTTTFRTAGNGTSGSSTGSSSSVGTGSDTEEVDTGAGFSIPRNERMTFNANSNNGFTNPFVPMSPNNFVDQNAFAHGSGGNFGGYATPRNDGTEMSFFYHNDQGGGNFGGYAGPNNDGTERSVLFPSNLNANSIAGGYAGPNTDGTERSFTFPNVDLNNGMGTGFGGFPTFGGGGGVPTVGSAPIGAFNGFSPLLGLSGSYGTPGGAFGGGGPGFNSGGYLGPGMPASSGMSGAGSTGGGEVSGTSSIPEDEKSNGSIARAAGANLNQNRGAASLRQANPFFGQIPITGPSGPAIGTMGEHMAATPESWADIAAMDAAAARPAGNRIHRAQQLRTRDNYRTGSGTARGASVNRSGKNGNGGLSTTSGDGSFGFFGGSNAIAAAINAGMSYSMPFLGGSAQPPLAWYTAARNYRNHFEPQSFIAAGNGLQGSTVEQKLAEKEPLCPERAIGRVIGSMCFDNGDIITYGTAGTLRLAADNSGSITFNNGQVLTFVKAPEALRRVALQSTFMF